jgi:hypothetical protein
MAESKKGPLMAVRDRVTIRTLASAPCTTLLSLAYSPHYQAG